MAMDKLDELDEAVAAWRLLPLTVPYCERCAGRHHCVHLDPSVHSPGLY